ncbi:MAG TPA: hypothetical protein VM008_06545 [Phycisphaerae bacterium]|nr:hypothetical protein [Phycisphaerae bacterium]
MKVLIVGGFGMAIGDGEVYWTLGETLAINGNVTRLRECDQTGKAAPVTSDDIIWADAVVCYSYGMASYINLVHDLAKDWPNGKIHQLLVVVAGVPDFWMGQFYTDLWQLPAFVQLGRCFQVDAIPASEPIQNGGNAWANFGDALPANTRWGNFNCDALFASLLPVDKHTHIQNDPQVVSAIQSIFRSVASPAGPESPPPAA